MAQIHVIEPCYEELEKIKAQMIADNKTKDEPERISFSKVVCMLIREYYSAKKLGGASPPASINDITEKSISYVDESSHIQGGNTISPVEISPFPVLETTKLYFNILEKDYENFLALNMKFYVLHQNDLDDVPIAVEDGKHVVFVETSFVPEYRKFMNENNFMEA